MTDNLENKVKDWAKARKALLRFLVDREEWMKASKAGNEVIQPLPESLQNLWNSLANAEGALYDAIKGEIE